MGQVLRKMASTTSCCASCSDPSTRQSRHRTTQKRLNQMGSMWKEELLNGALPRMTSNDPTNYLPNFDEIDQKTKDLVIGFINMAQVEFPNDKSYYNIPDMVHYIC
eukprot:319652_1